MRMNPLAVVAMHAVLKLYNIIEVVFAKKDFLRI